MRPCTIAPPLERAQADEFYQGFLGFSVDRDHLRASTTSRLLTSTSTEAILAERKRIKLATIANPAYDAGDRAVMWANDSVLGLH
ncbi:hypothetical protein [Nitrobacter sp. JJSN]|uniref:hypothetical protein n=1 Tax=Nitrobacter sp. JJSN TaxID=3453033 RepID=UPI003F771B46